MVSAEVCYCVSFLVSALAKQYGFHDRRDDLSCEIDDLAEQAFELASPIPDYEAAATEAGWTPIGDGGFRRPALDGEEHDALTSEGVSIIEANSVFDACENDSIEPYDREVFEHWIVTDWLAERLTAEGEKVDTDFAGLTVWARTTTGQAIYADGVIERIYAATHKADV